MNDFFEKLFADDETGRGYTRRELILYGVITPIAFVLIIGLAGWIETTLAR